MTGAIKESVLRLYMSHPFPLGTTAQRRAALPAKICAYEYLGLAPHMPGARFLDVGCGTGDNSCLITKHYGVREWVGLDQSRASLEVARRTAAAEGHPAFTPTEGDALDLPFPDGSFDVVVSWGVLHHTSDPRRGLAEMVRVCRPGGHVAIYLYNKFAHWRHNLQKDRVSRLGGDDVEKRFEVALRLYGEGRRAEEMAPDEVARFYDQYCHPHKSDHTLGETLDWFEALGVEYSGSYPPLALRDAIGILQYRGTELASYPLERARAKLAVKVATALPPVGRGEPRRPARWQRALWQAVYAWQGRRGGYSAGAALAGRKA